MKLSASPVVGLFLLATLVEASAAYSVLEHWTKRATNAVNRVRFVGGQFVAVGNNGLIMTSSNGANWISCSLICLPGRATHNFLFARRCRLMAVWS